MIRNAFDNRTKPKLRVLYVLHTLQHAGAETMVRDLIAHRPVEIEAAVICLDTEGPLADELRARGVRVTCTGRRAGLDWRQVSRIARVIRSFRPDVIHCHQYTCFFYAGLARTLGGRGAVVYTEHGRPWPDRVGWKRRTANRLLGRAARRISAVCEFTRESLEARERMPPERISVIYNGVDVARFARSASRELMRAQLGLPGDSAVIIQVGTFRPIKDQATAIRAFVEIRRRCPRAVLVFVGDGPDLASCRQLADRLDVADAVRFLGHRCDIADLLAASDVMLTTSRSEAHSLAVLEAMASKLPVVATRVGGIPETVVDGVTGLLADRGDEAAIAGHVVRLLTDHGLRDRMGRAGYDRVRRHFRQEDMHERYLAMYRAAAGIGGGS